MAYLIDPEPCINCGLCRLTCPTGAVRYFSTGHRTHVIDAEWCIDCDLCAQVCPVDCIDSLPEEKPEPEQLELARDRARRFAHNGRAVGGDLAARARAVIAARRGAS